MATLHMVTSLVEEHGRSQIRNATEIMNQADQLRQAARTLSVSWEGGDAADFTGALAQLALRLEGHAQQLENLGSLVEFEAHEWEQADQYSGSSGWTPVSGSQSSEVNAGNGTGDDERDFNWIDWGASASKLGEKGLEKTQWGSANKFGLGIAGLGIGLMFGAWSDIQSGDNIWRAAGSETIETALDLIIPGASVYSLGLAAFSLVGGGLELAGYHDGSVRVQETVEKLDVTDKLGDAIYDFATEHPLSAAKVALTPLSPIIMTTVVATDPNFIRFTGDFLADNLTDFGSVISEIGVGLSDVGEWVGNTSDAVADFVANH